jgi:NTP pyrophosphatase (non-canonical NTP hydrolase)
MSTQMSELLILRKQLRQFATEREWTSFHTPKNLASALVVEAAELLEPFQWLATGNANELGEQQYQAVADEMADVLSYLILLADQLNIDLYQATVEKIKRNAQKYPVELVKGSAKKYTAY